MNRQAGHPDWQWHTRNTVEVEQKTERPDIRGPSPDIRHIRKPRTSGKFTKLKQPLDSTGQTSGREAQKFRVQGEPGHPV